MKNSSYRHSSLLETGEGEENNQESILIHVFPENKSRWNHIEDLDAFFTRVYKYHQHHGFTCMILEELFQLFQFAFVVCFSTFLLKCVNYSILFKDELPPTGSKVTLSDVLTSPGECSSSFGPGIWTALIVASICWMLRGIGVIYHLFQYWEMRSFYLTALHIGDKDLENLTWHEIQQRLRVAQKEFQMCIHKQELTEIDIYHRILRFKNYMVAMVNKSILPLKFNVPFMGETIFLTRSLKYNIEFLLFWGPWAPFDNSWHLRDDYKRPNKRRELGQHLAKYIGYVGIVNFFLAPLILLWQLLYAFFSYAEVVKREPGTLGMRKWSLYGRLYLRHFNELDHELQARLNRAYRPANHYLSGFASNLVAVIARNLAFVCGAVLAVLLLLTIYDEDVITVEHVLTIMTVLGAIVAGCRVFIPVENLVWCPETLTEAILAQVHYLPPEWKGQAHTAQVRMEFSQLFQFRAVYLFEELLSPLVTPFILYFVLRPKALEIVDFLRQFTIEVVGVGDVCSFAQLDLHKHGHPQWQSSVLSVEKSSENEQQPYETEQLCRQAEDGKTELSLIHFALTNPEWRPSKAAEGFLTALRSQIQQEMTSNPWMFQYNNAASFTAMGGGSDSPAMQSLMRPNFVPPQQDQQWRSCSLIGRGITKSEGPRSLPENRSFISLSGEGANSESVWEGKAMATEPVAVNMAVSTLYLHDLIHRRNQPQRLNANVGPMVMPGIRESPDEEEQHHDENAAAAALWAAVDNLSGRMAKSN